MNRDDQSQAVTTSVVVCVNNRPKQIAECVASLQASADRDFEIVVVDDASTDETPAVVRQLAERATDTSLRIVTLRERRGASAARNRGIEAAAGELVLFVDSDCTVEPEWLTAMKRAFGEQPWAAASGCVREPAARNIAELAYAGSCRITTHPWSGPGLVGCNMAIRRSVALRIPFDEALPIYGEEDDLARRLRASGQAIGYVPEGIVWHRHPMTVAAYLSQAVRHGRGSARLWYKHGIYIGRDVAPILAALLLLPLGFVHVALLVIPAGLLGLQVLALLLNELSLKGKSLLQAIMVLPLEVVYRLIKGISVVQTLVMILLGRDPSIVASRKSLILSELKF